MVYDLIGRDIKDHYFGKQDLRPLILKVYYIKFNPLYLEHHHVYTVSFDRYRNPGGNADSGFLIFELNDCLLVLPQPQLISPSGLPPGCCGELAHLYALAEGSNSVALAGVGVICA